MLEKPLKLFQVYLVGRITFFSETGHEDPGELIEDTRQKSVTYFCSLTLICMDFSLIVYLSTTFRQN